MSCCARSDLPPEVEEVRQMIRSIKHSPSLKGLSCICNDGVLRSFSSEGKVIDYIRLNPGQIANSMMLFPEEVREQCVNVFEGVDGHDVPEDQLYHPDPKIVPPGLKGISSQVEKDTDGTKG